ADIVVTGRVVDSAIVLGPLMHEFGWRADDYQRLAAGSLAGHLLECGPQVTGGIFTDWASVPGWEDMGYPIAECAGDGSFVVSKPRGTGGLVTRATVAEQMLYEIADPRAYLLPDVSCDFTAVTLDEVGPDRVRVAGARGRAPTPTYKVSATYADGFRAITTITIGGPEAAAKAHRVGEAIIARTRRLFRERNLGDYRAVSIEVLGAEDTYGAHAGAAIRATREVVLKLGVQHESKAALDLFAREVAPAASSMAQGLAGFFAGRPNVQPVVRLFSCLWPKERTPVSVEIDGRSLEVAVSAGEAAPSLAPMAPPAAAADAPDASVAVPLIALAWGRSGDKGNNANIGVIARDPAYVPYLRAALTEAAVARWFAHLLEGPVERFELPGINAFNFVLHEALGGGGIASLRIDPQGKAFAQMLMDMPVPVSPAIAARVRPANARQAS
ncbi:MAG TPA: acyclic terpene utilization AtuA family protein, partial [Candidatus Sulfotelmatobacter sp.]|nr:acyclic terpene utilization AtuA family protein [Candidatus Sulfotelmatobacter sp.]